MFGLFHPFRLQASPTHKRSPRHGLQVEELESRTLLSTLTPIQVRHAYGLDQANYTSNGRSIHGDGSGQTIAIIDAYYDPYVASDLQTFDRAYGLSAANFRSYSYGTATNDGWATETDLDVEWAHAVAPGANIMLVSAKSDSSQDLYNAVNWARQQPGVSVVSLSWGAPEWSGETGQDSLLTTPAGHSGITFVASSGDHGAGAQYPAASPNVLSVGGTNLYADSQGNYQVETGWSGSGGGVSQYEREPSYQDSVQSSGRRTIPDVAYNAGTGVWVYSTKPSTRHLGLLSCTGTSCGAPQWAGIVAIGDQVRVALGERTLDGASQTLYALYNSTWTGDFHDITSGSSGYNAHAGYDLVTGRGTPYAARIILDLARVNDSFHGAVVANAAMSGTGGVARPASFFAEAVGGDAAPVAEAAPAANLLAMAAPEASQSAPLAAVSVVEATSSDATPAADLADVSAFGNEAAARVIAQVRAVKVSAEFANADALFTTGRWLEAL